jgi:hypothetical protein
MLGDPLMWTVDRFEEPVLLLLLLLLAHCGHFHLQDIHRIGDESCPSARVQHPAAGGVCD